MVLLFFIVYSVVENGDLRLGDAHTHSSGQRWKGAHDAPLFYGGQLMVNVVVLSEEFGEGLSRNGRFRHEMKHHSKVP